MPSSSENIQPTRGELLKLKKRIELAERGHELLREKRDALVTEFFDNLDIMKDKKEKVDEEMEEAFKALIEAKVDSGELNLERIGDASKRDIDVDINSRNIMGVRVPLMEAEDVERDITERGYDLQETATSIDEASKKFEEALKAILELAETEEIVKSLAREIEKTKRRVNSLEHVLIPRLESNREYIEMRLEEQEREDKFRMKRVKQKIESQQS
uniref:ATPase, V1/A1 complex, subunit D n=1 Tax=uncultured organism TaxID=155900 RepID=M1PQT7_9ZZZZ|nr:ATPase, V1/A1 complex, subunit D [uncultured organism]